MRPLLLAAALSTGLCALAQDPEPALYLVPRWKVGDTRTLQISEVEHEVKDGVNSDDRTELKAVYRVVNEDANNYVLRVQYENFLLSQVRKIAQASEPKLEPYKEVPLRYTVSKKDGTAHLENWKEAQQVMQKSLNTVLTGTARNDSTITAALSLALLPVLGQFKDQESVEGYFQPVIDYVTFPFGKQLTEKDTLRAEGYGQNPFALAATDSVRMVTLTNLRSIDREQQQATVRRETQVDLAAFTAMLKDLARRMVGSAQMTAAERKKVEAKMEADLKAMNFTMQSEALYTVDLHTTWPAGFKATIHVASTAGHGKSADSVKTITVTVMP